MTIRIDVEPDAREQLDELDVWWREHRPAAASVVTDELHRIVALLRENPEIGVPYTNGGSKNIRWLRLKKTPYKVYYHHEPGTNLVSIIYAWSGMRGDPPALPTK